MSRKGGGDKASSSDRLAEKWTGKGQRLNGENGGVEETIGKSTEN